MRPGDYVQEGLVYCGTCNEPRQTARTIPEFMRGKLGETMMISRPCACNRARDAETDAQCNDETHRREVDRLRMEGIKDTRLRAYTFAADDQPESTVSKACKRYVAKWENMRAQNIGIMLMGDPGGGKTFYAAAIANALIEREVSVTMTTIPEISAKMSTDYGNGRDDVLERIKRVPLLVLDDYGFERSTSYGMENAYTIINTRYTAGKPLIVTTNLTQDEMANPPDVAHSRIMSRLKEMCAAPLKVVGSRRDGIAADKRRAVMDILFGED